MNLAEIAQKCLERGFEKVVIGGTFCMRSKKTRKYKQKKVGKEKKCPKREEKETLRQRSGVSRKATRVEKCRHVPL